MEIVIGSSINAIQCSVFPEELFSIASLVKTRLTVIFTKLLYKYKLSR